MRLKAYTFLHIMLGYFPITLHEIKEKIMKTEKEISYATIITGYADIVLKIITDGLEKLNDILSKISQLEEVSKMTTFIVLKEGIFKAINAEDLTAVILFKTLPNKTANVQAELVKRAGIYSSDIVAGEFDILVEASLPLRDLPNNIAEMQNIDGVKSTTTCITHLAMEKCR